MLCSFRPFRSPHSKMDDGSMWIFDPRLILESNTVESPLQDGGGAVTLETADKTKCSNVPRTFLNEDSCVLSTEASACNVGISVDATFELSDENIKQINTLTGRYGTPLAIRQIRLLAAA